MEIAESQLVGVDEWPTDPRERAIHVADAQDAIKILRGDLDAIDALGWPTTDDDEDE
jgi:hypothetical protein